MTADFVVEWQLGHRVGGGDLQVLLTSEDEDVAISAWAPTPEDWRNPPSG